MLAIQLTFQNVLRSQNRLSVLNLPRGSTEDIQRTYPRPKPFISLPLRQFAADDIDLPSMSSSSREPLNPHLHARMLSCVSWTQTNERRWLRYCQILPVRTSGAHCAETVCAIVGSEDKLELSGGQQSRVYLHNEAASISYIQSETPVVLNSHATPE